ncbi:GNAT family N-acetyltransferase [Halopseudomonas pelagia]|uniref:GNAT family N-acetyltransferase n=1 Tax=Halopseudomonas pelagia TaxID=553151 RepID=UPI0003A64067|nr:GNAT family N-acetyltransferase [Halopseudomonas pelagia]
MNIRPADLSDLPDLLLFEQAVVAAEQPYNPEIRDKARYYDLDRLIADELSLLLVAELDGVLVGCGYAQIRESKAHLQHTRHSYLGFMYVQPAHRGQGINQNIIDRLLAWSREKQALRCYLDVYAGNAAAIRAYEKVGFNSSLIEMKLCLD